ncbi:hypothetical protein [Clostridium ljungdahlii]|uniref:Uncharacterized protein n=1 Tax=Clostridium ljungdahlii (strain ATCC 55383 / DSM 13528 / PETC) TaxID=748727 RepID=D8GU74_CLOLD|nr:hypothetical protein [Clostridium ljungdahlii]ADK14737.1 hypothetical protein CLJU_c16730 [Clostridium ljungdahlii DSM 13528]OAA84093.1 hypothetical protein WX45_01937 [Clostridium ljungdahlii DSM 13528]
MKKDLFTREEVQQIVDGYVNLIQKQEDMIQKLYKQINQDNIQFQKNNQILYRISKVIESEE